MQTIKAQALTPTAFAPFGDVLAADGTPDKIINQGKCGRYHDRAQVDFDAQGRAGISLFKADVRALPYECNLLERHPEGSQAFIPMSLCAFLVIVAPDAGGVPGAPLAFIAPPGMAINFHRGTWHGVLTPLEEPGLFAVVDRIGPGANLEEHALSRPVLVVK